MLLKHFDTSFFIVGTFGNKISKIIKSEGTRKIVVELKFLVSNYL